MGPRKWLVRSLYLALLTAIFSGGFIVYSWISPDFVESELTSQIQEKFYDVDVEVQSAHMRILGGISATDLRLIRRDDPTRTPFLHVPSAILYQDKEQLNDGKLVIRKVEMFKPRLRIERDAEGKWNLANILRPKKDDTPAPMLILHEATIVFVDHRQNETPIAEWKDVEATIVNDPLPVFTVQMRGGGKLTGPIAIEGRYDNRMGFAGSVDLSNIAVGPELAQAVTAIAPNICEYVKPMKAKASIHADLVWQMTPISSLNYDVKAQIKEGRYEHPNLPFVLERIEASLRNKNGNISVEKAKAHIGQGTISVTMDLPKEPVCAPGTVPLSLPTVAASASGGPKSLEQDVTPFMEFEDRLRSLEVIATNLNITPELIQRLPGKAQLAKEIFMPSGPICMKFNYLRHEGGWKKDLILQPSGMEVTYRGFPYKMRNVRGTIHHSVTDASPDVIVVDLLADGAGTTASVTGTVKGTEPDIDVNLNISANGATLEKELIDAMPDDNPEVLRRLHATAFGDVRGEIRHNARTRREYGPKIFDNEYTITIRNGTMKYEAFPYPLENIVGTLVVRTVPEKPTQLPPTLGNPMQALEPSDSTTLRFEKFLATHNGAKLQGGGRKDPAPGGSNLELDINAQSLPLDSDLRIALSAIKMEQSWAKINPSGRMDCAIRVNLFTKTDPTASLDAAENLRMGMAFRGASIRPSFFFYQMDQVQGRVAYAKGRVELREFAAIHGKTLLTLPYCQVLFRPSGGYWANVLNARIAPFVMDDDLLRALPQGLKSACEQLALKGPMSLHATRLVVDEKPGPHMPRNLPGSTGEMPDETLKTSLPVQTYPHTAPPRPILPIIYWDGSIVLEGASLQTGVPWESVHGILASRGRYEGDRLGTVIGNIVFDKALVAKQPVEAVTAALRVYSNNPDNLIFPAIRAKMYGGDIGGEAKVFLESPVRYEMKLDAARVRLSQIANHYNLPKKAQLEGLASGQIYLKSQFDERTGLPVIQGGGNIDVPTAKLLNLPVLLNLIKVVKLRVPDDTGFEEAHALFFIHGNRLRIGQLDLIGNAVSLVGEGQMNLDGTDLIFEFYPVWTKLKELFPLPGDWPGAVSKRFLKIKVTGELDKLEYKPEPVPGVIEPVKRVIERLKNK